MARKIETMPKITVGRDAKYPWDEWLDGSVWELVQGEDFDCRPNSLRNAAHGAASRFGIRLDSSISGTHVYLQAQR